MSVQALLMVFSRLRNTGVACTAARVNVVLPVLTKAHAPPFPRRTLRQTIVHRAGPASLPGQGATPCGDIDSPLLYSSRGLSGPSRSSGA